MRERERERERERGGREGEEEKEKRERGRGRRKRVGGRERGKQTDRQTDVKGSKDLHYSPNISVFKPAIRMHTSTGLIVC